MRRGILAAICAVFVLAASKSHATSSKGLSEKDAKKVCLLGKALERASDIARKTVTQAATQLKERHTKAQDIAARLAALDNINASQLGAEGEEVLRALRQAKIAATTDVLTLTDALVEASACAKEFARNAASVMQFVQIAGSLAIKNSAGNNAKPCLNNGATSQGTSPGAKAKNIATVIAAVCTEVATQLSNITTADAIAEKFEASNFDTHFGKLATSSEAYGQKITTTTSQEGCPLFSRYANSIEAAALWITESEAQGTGGKGNGQGASGADAKATLGTFYTVIASTSSDDDGTIATQKDASAAKEARAHAPTLAAFLTAKDVPELEETPAQLATRLKSAATNVTATTKKTQQDTEATQKLASRADTLIQRLKANARTEGTGDATNTEADQPEATRQTEPGSAQTHRRNPPSTKKDTKASPPADSSETSHKNNAAMKALSTHALFGMLVWWTQKR
ncbi:hypothetical protein ERJ75_001167400 [Trypanosoma vivax]|nr:hypothetical protein ERJ75_001167400 [Trypanosoma vivax]